MWLKDITKLEVDDNIVVYCFYQVPLGLICSPFLLAATIKFHLQKEELPLALCILNNIYVNNVLIGVDSVSQAYRAYCEAKRISSMNLREWNSNSLESLNQIVDIECVCVFVVTYQKCLECCGIGSMIWFLFQELTTLFQVVLSSLHHMSKIRI